MTKEEIIAEVRKSLAKLNINKVILFGSYSRQEQQPDSDIDLLVVTSDNFIFDSFTKKMETKLVIAAALNELRKKADIDLIVHTKPMFEKFLLLNSGFSKEIINNGTVIYEADN